MKLQEHLGAVCGSVSTGNATKLFRAVNRRGTLWIAIFVLAMVIAASAQVFGQNAGRVSGFVHDPSGAVIPGATVVLRNEASGTELKTVADGSGVYSLDPVPPGTYMLTVAMPGFKTSSQSGLMVDSASHLERSITLDVGQQIERVEVTAAPVNLVTTDSGAKTDVITARQIQNLSIVGRNAMELLTLLPGVVNTGFSSQQGSSFGQGVNQFNINGLRNDQNDFRMDNAKMIDQGNNGGFIIEPNIEMVQEFSVKTSNFEADQGRSGLIIDTVTKSGGSGLHGEVYYFGRNAALNANDWSNVINGTAKPNSKFNYPGFNIGGPVRIPGTDFNKNKDKMFFFAAFEWQRQLVDPGTELATVPSAAMRTGDFSQFLAQGNTLTGPTTGGKSFCAAQGRYLNMPCQVNDPNTGATIASGILTAANGVTSNGMVFLNAFPLPNYVDPNGRYNFAGQPLDPLNRNEENFRVDYNLNDSTRMYLRLARNADHQLYPYGLWSGENSGWTSNIPEPSPALGINRGKALALNVVKVISPTLTNESQFNVQSFNNPNNYQNPAKMSSAALGFNFKGMSFGGVSPRINTIPQIIDAWSYSGGNPGAGRWGEGDVGSGIFAAKTEFEWIDNVTKVKGTHTIKFGGLLDRTRANQNNPNSPTEGQFITDAGWGNTTKNEFGDILTEHVKSYSQQNVDPVGNWRYWDVEGYLQDSWKATRRLTLNYGARVAWGQPWGEVKGLAVTFDPLAYKSGAITGSTNGIPNQFLNGVLTSKNHQVSNSVYPNPNPIIQPRLGLAYDIFGTGKTVVRGGLGTYVSRDQGNVVFYMSSALPNAIGSNPTPPFSSFNQITTTDPFGSLGNISLTAANKRDANQPQTYEYSFTLSQNIGLKTVLEGSYVGNTSRHLFIQRDINNIPLGGMWTPGTDKLSSTNSQSFRPFQPYGAIHWSDHSQTANYNSLQVTARRNVSQGLTLLASYTWSKTLGYSTAFNNSVDPFNTRRNYGLLNYDRAHLLNFSYIYQIPSEGARHFNGNKVASGVLDHWQLSGVTHFSSGAPLRVSLSGIGCRDVNGGTPALCGGGSFTGDARTWLGEDNGDVPLAPLLLSNPGAGVTHKGVHTPWVNGASIGLPNIGKFGTFEQPTFRGPGSNNFDLTLFKSFSLGEQRRIEFRWAAFNIFNRGQYSDPPVNNASINWILPLGATDLNQGHSSGITNFSPGNFGYINNETGHREMEVALKIYF